MKQLIDRYKTLRTQKEYLKIILANIINRFGDSIDAIAFTWIVYELTHSAAWSTIIFGVNMLPTMILQPFAGAFVERLYKKNIMIFCDIARGIFVALIAFCFILKILTPEMLLIITLLNSTFESLRVPAGLAIVPRLLEEQYYDTGIALNASLCRAMELIGTGCAGFIIAIFGVPIAILIDAFTFMGSAFIIFLIHYKEEIKQEKLSISSYLESLKAGFYYVRTRQSVILLCFIGAMINMIVVPINSMMPVYIDKVLQGGSETLSILTIGITIGSILGSILYPIIADKVTKRWLLLITLLYSGSFYLLIIVLPTLLSAPILNVIIIFTLFMTLGFIAALVGTFTSVFLTISVPHDYMARVGAVFNACVTMTIPVCSLLITIMLQFVSFIWIIIATGFISIMIALLLMTMKSVYVLDKKA